MFLSIFDQTLTAHFLKTDDARINRFLLLKQMTPTVHDDTISDDTAPSSGSSELIKFKTINAIYFCYSYPILMTISSFDWKFYWLSEMGIKFCHFLKFHWFLFLFCVIYSYFVVTQLKKGFPSVWHILRIKARDWPHLGSWNN